MTVKVYGLCLKNDDKIRYVGQTSRSLSARFTEHKNRASTGCCPSARWIHKHKGNIDIVLLEEHCTLDIDEAKWIAFFRTIHNDLLNILDYGSGISTGFKMSNITKQRMSKPKSETTKAKMSLAQNGNTKSLGENNSHAVLNESDIVMIRDMASRGISLTQIAKEYNVQKAAIWKIKEKITWKHIA